MLVDRREAAIEHAEENQPLASRDAAMRGLYMDIGRARAELGYEPAYSVDDAMAEYSDWLRQHPE